ncbi:hypothetical protein N7540_012484 [Penicillium herquei]|nr:hypothetical protein N7540_012484 [Penicillium herquei]
MESNTLVLFVLKGILTALGLLSASMIFFERSSPSHQPGGDENARHQLIETTAIRLKAITTRTNTLFQRKQDFEIRHNALSRNLERASKPNELMMEEMPALAEELKFIELEMEWIQEESKATNDEVASLKQILEVPEAS